MFKVRYRDVNEYSIRSHVAASNILVNDQVCQEDIWVPTPLTLAIDLLLPPTLETFSRRKRRLGVLGSLKIKIGSVSVRDMFGPFKVMI